MLSGWAKLWAGDRPDPLGIFLEGRIIGTSAGSIIGSYLAVHGHLEHLAALQAEAGSTHGKPPKLFRFLLAYLLARFFTRDMAGFRRSMGRSALRASVPGEQEWVELVARSYAPQGPWPSKPDLRITVVDAAGGELEAWDRHSDIPLATAVAASCAMPCAYPLVHARSRAWMDGGIGSSTNAGLAAGCSRVLILDPLGRPPSAAAQNALRITSQAGRECRDLQAGGSRVLLLQPSAQILGAVGRNFFDLSRLPAVAALTGTQARATAGAVHQLLFSA